MNIIFVIVSLMILSPFSAMQIKPKFCIDCKFFKKDSSISSFDNNKYGKCTLFENERGNDNFLVDGIDNSKKEYTYCSIARKYEDMCGKEGKFYEKKRKEKIKYLI